MIELTINQVIFRKKVENVGFVMANGVNFDQEVFICTEVQEPAKRFGIRQEHIQKFKNDLMKVEVEGRKFRTKYQIPMATGSPQAENFLWTILGNKVSLISNSYTIIKIYKKPLFLKLLMLRKLKKRANDFDTSNQQHSTGRSSQR